MWEFWIDRGGTFTDIISVSPNKDIFIDKYLSENEKKYKDASVFAIKKRLNIDINAPVPQSLIKQIRLGTTVATNALLERKGAKTLLITNKGYRDILEIKDQTRPDIFALNIIKPEKIYDLVIETDARIDKDGKILSSPDYDSLEEEIAKACKKGYNSAAIVLMHSYLFPKFEKKIKSILLKNGFNYVFESNKSAPVAKITTRGDTACCDAYLTPVLKEYINNFLKDLCAGNNQNREELKNKVLFMHSGGGLENLENFLGKESLLSGPAGGIAGAVKACELDGEKKVLSFDMGGTSTDVSHYNLEFQRKYENEIAGVKLFYPMLDIHTVAAGGGSIVYFDGEKFRVGPKSAGSNPGPACYRNNGPLTITDCNLFLGRIQKESFPKVFGKNSDLGPDLKILKKKFLEIKKEIKKSINLSLKEEEIAEGFLKIASKKMASAIKRISLEKGRDTTKYVLCSFGGAGGQHACEIADILSIKKILIHPYSGVLSAYGIGVSDKTKVIEKTIGIDLNNESLIKIELNFQLLIKDLTNESKIKPDIIIKKLHLKYMNSNIPIVVNFHEDIKKVLREFKDIHKDMFGFVRDGDEISISSISVELSEKSKSTKIEQTFNSKRVKHIKKVKIFLNKKYVKAKVYKRQDLTPDFKVKGPAIIVEKTGTNLVKEGWHGKVLNSGNLYLIKEDKTKVESKNLIDIKKPDPVYLEIFNSLFSYIAQEMGITLEKTAFSVNIKERKDFSCALFDKQGRLVANAPHIPVHLGSMESSITGIINDNLKIKPNDVYLTNNPMKGGTHLPDLTVITPVFKSMVIDKKVGRDELLFFTASRGHHSDIGGITPGSMPSSSRELFEEGVIIDNLLICENENFLEENLLKTLLSTDFPCRNPKINISDIKSQIAANNKGIKSIKKSIKEYGLDVILKYMEFIRDNARNSVINILPDINQGSYQIKLDNKSVIKVSISVENQRLKIDFTGTSKAKDDNYNAPESVTKAAVLYVLRTIIDKDIPLNSGCLEPVDIIIPKNSILSPNDNNAVCAGNVEISQVVCDLLFSAFNTLASSQGTMNNFTFGNQKFQYYETICGGAPAGDGFDGCDAVHTHMTNSLITDPEILELRLPVILEEFSIRKNSGGKGKYTGGSGVKRKILFLEDVEASFLTNKRLFPPHGINGGNNAQTGENIIIYKDRGKYFASHKEAVKLKKGDKVIIKTPGGGGFGSESI